MGRFKNFFLRGPRGDKAGLSREQIDAAKAQIQQLLRTLERGKGIERATFEATDEKDLAVAREMVDDGILEAGVLESKSGFRILKSIGTGNPIFILRRDHKDFDWHKEPLIKVAQ